MTVLLLTCIEEMMPCDMRRTCMPRVQVHHCMAPISLTPEACALLPCSHPAACSSYVMPPPPPCVASIQALPMRFGQQKQCSERAYCLASGHIPPS